VAYVPDEFLTDGWHEDKGEEETGSSYFGIEKWAIKVYKRGDSSLTVASLKTIIMIDKENLLERVENDIFSAAERYGISLDETSEIKGERWLLNGHNSLFVIYNGSKGYRHYKFIGEVWSCSKSGISVICMGLADITEIDGLQSWEKMVGDPSGIIDGITRDDALIYNVNCH